MLDYATAHGRLGSATRSTSSKRHSEQTRCNPRGALVFLEQRRVRVEACGMLKPGEPRAELDGVTGRCDDSLSGKEVTRECSNQYPRTHAFHACSAFTDMS